jgi:hypothetical protein
MPFVFFILVGLIFGFLAGLFAFLITFNEWLHHYVSWREPFKMALKAGLFAFGFFLIISLALGIVLPLILK